MKKSPDRLKLLQQAVANMAKDNEEIIRKAQMNKPFLKGDPRAKLPERENRIGFITNPKLTRADEHLDAFGEALKLYRCGEYPKGVIEDWLAATCKVIDELEKVFRHSAYHISRTVVEGFARYLLTPNDETKADHCERIDEHIARLKRRFCQNSDAGYNKCTEEIERRERNEETNCGYKYPTIVLGEYTKRIVGMCERKEGLISIIGVGMFYVSPDNAKAWQIIRKLVETDSKDGYAYLFDEGQWRGAFSPSKQGGIPEDKAALGCRSANEFSKYIHAMGRNGYFRIEKMKSR